MGAKGAVEIIFKGKDVDQKTIEYTDRCFDILLGESFEVVFFPYLLGLPIQWLQLKGDS